MIHKAFVMQVHPDRQAEYERRHNPIWQDLEQVLKEHGVHNYNIFLHTETSQLFAYVEVEDEARWDAIAETDACRRWWAYMGDIMPTNPDGSPGPDCEVITWLDDHSRYALHLSAHHRVTAAIVLATFRQAADLHGHPAPTLTDIQSWWHGIRADLSAGGEDRCRPAPARHRCLTEWSARRLLAC